MCEPEHSLGSQDLTPSRKALKDDLVMEVFEPWYFWILGRRSVMTATHSCQKTAF